MKEQKRYDVTIIGAGPGGYVAAIRAAQLGLTTALVEKRQSLGGTCLNIGCIPSKALLSTTEFLLHAEHTAAEQGILFDTIRIDLQTMMQRKRKVVQKLTSGVASLMKHNKVDVYYGEGSVKDNETVIVREQSSGNTRSGDQRSEDRQVTDRQSKKGENERETVLRTDRIILATGSVPAELPVLPFDGEKIINSEDALSLDTVPKKLLIVGAGAIGLEMGSVWARLGSEVTVVEIMETIIPGWDRQVAAGLFRELKKQSIAFSLGTKVTECKTSKNGVTVTAESTSGPTVGRDNDTEVKDSGKTKKRKDTAAPKEEKISLSADKVLVAAGRKPFCPPDIIQVLQLETDKKGFITVNERYETNVSGVYAIGDVVPGPMLAHKAEEEGAAVAEIIAGKPGQVNYETVPGVVYTSPEAAMVGKTEEQLKDRQMPYKKGVFHFRANGRALASGHDEGFVKVLSHAETDRLLGVHIAGESAGTLISEAVTVMEFEGCAEDIGRTIHAHPTLPEAVKEAALAAFDRPIHGF